MQYLSEKYAMSTTILDHDWAEQEIFFDVEHSQDTLHIIDMVTAEEQERAQA
jgi:hypothetical protein